MAIVFISAKHKQKVFFWGISIVLISAMFLIAFIAFTSETPTNENTIVPPPVAGIPINFFILDAPQVIHLEPFEPAMIDHSSDGRQNPFSSPDQPPTRPTKK